MASPKSFELRQRYLNERREFYPQPNRIRIYVKDMDGDAETFVHYENLTTRTRRITRQDGRLYTIAISCGVFALVGYLMNIFGYPVLMRWAPIWAIATVILFGFHFYKRRRYFLVDLTTNRSLFFLDNRRSKEKLSTFIDSMYEARKNYLRETYFKISDPRDPENEIGKLQWLCNEGIITEAEFQVMKESLVVQSTKYFAQNPNRPKDTDTVVH